MLLFVLAPSLSSDWACLSHPPHFFYHSLYPLSPFLLFLSLSPKWQKNCQGTKEVLSEQSNKYTVKLICHQVWTLETPFLSPLLLQDDIFWAPSQVKVWCCHKYSIEYEISGSVTMQHWVFSSSEITTLHQAVKSWESSLGVNKKSICFSDGDWWSKWSIYQLDQNTQLDTIFYNK